MIPIYPSLLLQIALNKLIPSELCADCSKQVNSIGKNSHRKDLSLPDYCCGLEDSFFEVANFSAFRPD